MPNGVGPGPRLFTKLMKPVYAKLRNDGYISTGFIDDSLLAAETEIKCQNNIHATISLLTGLGFILNYEKSVLVPTRKITYLGNVIDSQKMIVFLPDEKKQIIKSECHQLYHGHYATIRTVARVIGLLVSAFSAVELGKLYYRELEKGKIVALKCQKRGF